MGMAVMGTGAGPGPGAADCWPEKSAGVGAPGPGTLVKALGPWA